MQTAASCLPMLLPAGIAAVAALSSFVTITALVVYLRATKSSLREALQERSSASLHSFLSSNSLGVLGTPFYAGAKQHSWAGAGLGAKVRLR